MLNCWQADAKSRLCFGEIVTELDKLINCDSGYFVLENEGVSHANEYVTVNPTKIPDDHYNTHEADLTTTPGDHHVDATDTPNGDVATTPDNQIMTTDADFTTPHDECVNPTITHDDYINPGIESDGCINSIVMLDADIEAAPDHDCQHVIDS